MVCIYSTAISFMGEKRIRFIMFYTGQRKIPAHNNNILKSLHF